MRESPIGDALQALVLETLRAKVDAGATLSLEDGRALLELAEAQRIAIADLRRTLSAHDVLALSYGQLAAEWLELVGILKLIGLEVGQASDRRPSGRAAGGWYWRVGDQQQGEYLDVISAYRAGLEVLIADLQRRVMPDCSADAARHRSSQF